MHASSGVASGGHDLFLLSFFVGLEVSRGKYVGIWSLSKSNVKD